MKRFFTVISFSLCLIALPSAAQPIFDAHLHYAKADTEHFSPEQILDIFAQNNIAYALISSTPNDGTQQLYNAAPNKIIPFLGLYEELWEGKRNWMHDPTTIPRLRKALKTGIYQGLGEFHIFGKDKHSPIFNEVLQIAKQQNLTMQVHGDAEIIRHIYNVNPNAKIIWAHMGTRPTANYLREILNHTPKTLYIDTSVRDQQLLGDNQQLDPGFKQLFLYYPDQFMVGVDTFSVNRWKKFDDVTQDIRTWLSQLPKEVAQKIAYSNAYELLVNNK